MNFALRSADGRTAVQFQASTPRQVAEGLAAAFAHPDAQPTPRGPFCHQPIVEHPTAGWLLIPADPSHSFNRSQFPLNRLAPVTLETAARFLRCAEAIMAKADFFEEQLDAIKSFAMGAIPRSET